MERAALNVKGRAHRARAALAAFVLAGLAFAPARAGDSIGIVLSTAPSGAASKAVTLRIAAEASSGSVPIFLRGAARSTLYGVRLSATPLRDEHGVVSVTPAFDLALRTISPDVVRRADVTVEGLRSLGTLTSTLYATHGSRTQTLGMLTVIHLRRSHELRIGAIAPARGVRQLPFGTTGVSMLVTVTNTGDRDASIAAPVVAALTIDGTARGAGDVPHLRVSERDGSPAHGPFLVRAGGALTLRLLLDDVRRTGRYAGTLMVSAPGHDPVEQSFGFVVKQGPWLPAILIALGVAISYTIRRRYSSGRVGRAGHRRLVERLVSDVGDARTRNGPLERRETVILDTFERRLVDVADELERAGFTRRGGDLIEIDRKIDLFVDFVTARRYVGAMAPSSLQTPFDPDLDEAAGFLIEQTAAGDLEARAAAMSKTLRGIPDAVEATVRERFLADVDGLLAALEASPAVAEALPIRVLGKVDAAKELSAAGRFGHASAELAGAQLAFTRVLTEAFLEKVPDADAAPPGFTAGWPRYRAEVVHALKALRAGRRGERAADRYRAVWQDYVIELATRLKTAAARERRTAAGGRKQRFAAVVEACDEAASKAIGFDPAAVDAYRVAVQGYLRATDGRPNAAVPRPALDQAHLPPPITVVAAGLGDVGGPSRASAGPPQSASLTRRIRARHWSLALVAGVAAIPSGLVLLWVPSDTWGSLTDGAAVFAWGLGVHVLVSVLDARRLGWAVIRDARAPRAGHEGPARTGADTPVAMAPMLRPEREPAR